MIDTNKYEGHTPADDWEKHLVDALFETEFPMTYQDNQLMADAPLLLEEVKRLREENKMLRHGINDAISMGSSGAKTPVADGSIKHYFPLYLLEMIE